MGMTTHLIGFKPPDAKFKKMKIVWEVCRDLGIEPPEEVSDFFEEGPPDEAGVQVDLNVSVHSPPVGVQRWVSNKDVTEHQAGIEVDLNALAKSHPDVKILRFYNSW